MKEPSKRMLILGLGNPLSGDDGFGARVLELLQRIVTAFPPDVSLADAHTDLLGHIEDFSEYNRIVLIDAILDSEGGTGPPGRVVVLEEEAFSPWPETSQSIHQLSPLLAVKMFRLLHPAAKTRITLVGLLVDRLTRAPLYATDERIQEAASIVTTLLGMP